MDWTYAIERNRDALKRVLLALVAMAGLAATGLPFSPFTGRRCPEGADEGQRHARPTLPRHLHRAVLRLLRPAEAAARRLVIMAARGLVETPPRSRPRKPKPKQPHPRPGLVTGIWMPPQLQAQAGRRAARAESCALPLFDPLPRMSGDKRKAAKGVPRISIPGMGAPFPVLPERQPEDRRPRGPDDPIDAARLARRLQALAAALDDLPREARRFARWRAQGAVGAGAQNEDRDAARERESQASRPAGARRIWPLKPGRPPGVGRRAGSARRLSGSRRAVHPVHEILSDTHALAVQALERFDTS